MASRETPETIAATRTVTASAVLENRVDLRGYPFRYLAIVAYGAGAGQGVSFALAAADVLDRVGWELLNVTELSNMIFAFLRRR